MTIIKESRWLWSMLAACLLSGGCAIKRDEYHVPNVPLPNQLKNIPVASIAQPVTSTSDNTPTTNTNQLQLALVLNEWWYSLGNEELNRLIDQALANNNDLRIATLRIAQTQARAQQAFADQFPELSAIGQGHHDSPANGINSFTGFGNQQARQYAQVGPRADWRVDLWGELKAAAEAAEMEAWSSSYLRDDTRRQLIANVIGRYIEYLSLNDRMSVAEETKAALQQLLNAVNERLQFGDATLIELEQQRSAVLAVEATIPGLELQREQAVNALALLLGITPGNLHLSTQGIDTLQLPAIQPVVPSELLLRRPDVRAIEARLLAADADIDIARARVLPPLDITAQAGWGILALGSLTTPYGPLFNLAANLSATIFDYGKRMHEVDFAHAMHEELVENYIRVIYGAVQETENALANQHHNGKRLEAQRIATEAALRAWQASKASYAYGDIDFLTLLDTERTYHRNLDEYHRLRMERYLGVVSIFSALGGGVTPGDRLPGEGNRPASNNHGATDTKLPASGIVWEDLEANKPYWLVQLAGLQDPAGIGHVWRDLQQRFGALMINRMLFPREVGRMVKDKQERIRWYRLFVGQFIEAAEAEQFCKGLQAGQLRCEVVASDNSTFDNLSAEKPETVTETVRGEPEIPAQAMLKDAPLATAEKLTFNLESTDLAEPSLGTQRVSPPTASALNYSEAYAVQLNFAGTLADAQLEQQRWTQRGIEGYIAPVTDIDGRIRYTVRIGNFPNLPAAVEQLLNWHQQFDLDGAPVTIRLNADNPSMPAPE
jgi:NodT family efflux transporter outer membrane factor (OMF) lipoprotein